MSSGRVVSPAKAGVQEISEGLDSGLRRNDGKDLRQGGYSQALQKIFSDSLLLQNGARPTNILVIPPVIASEEVSVKLASSISWSHASGLGKSAMESLR
jgi:hypothetical protein